MIIRMNTSILRGRLVNELGRRIAAGTIAPGQLVAPDAVAAEFGVSRTVVREAFKGLEARGMIRARHRVGTVVLARAEWNLLDPEVIAWRQDGPDADAQLQELMTLREAVEPMAVTLAAERASAAELASLEIAAAEMRQAFLEGSVPRFERADRTFHATILVMARNEVLAQLLSTIDATLHSRYLGRRAEFTEATGPAVALHEELATALSRRDPHAGAKLSRRLVADARIELWPLVNS